MRWCAGALLLLLAACAGTSTPPPSDREVPARDRPLLVSTRCADVVVLGARGSQQSAALNRGVGAEVLASVQAMALRVHARSRTTIRLEAVRYDAKGGVTYQQDVVDGARLVAGRLAALAETCRRSRLALVGFSEGAQVVHGAVLDVPAPLARRISLVAMIADPRRNPGDAIAQWSYGTRLTQPGRLGAGTPVDPDVRSRAISLCVGGDEICNARGAPGAPPSATHRHFYEKPASARSTGAQLARILGRTGD